jgi:hypothetical protein
VQIHILPADPYIPPMPVLFQLVNDPTPSPAFRASAPILVGFDLQMELPLVVSKPSGAYFQVLYFEELSDKLVDVHYSLPG